MQRNFSDNWQVRLLSGCVASALVLLVGGAAWAQSGSLDMDVAPSAPALPQVAPHQSGDLDMDVNTKAPVTADTAGQKRPGANVQDGIVVFTPAVPSADQAASPSAPTGPTPTGTAPIGTAAPSPVVAGQTIPTEPVTLDHPAVINTAKLKAGDTTVSLFGIEGQTGDAAQGLQSFLASSNDHLTCQAQTSADFVCLLPDGTDVAQAALVNGAARAMTDAPEAYHEQEALAQAARRGIWASLPAPPAVIKHPTVVDTATLVVDGQKLVLDGIIGLGAPYAAELQSYIAANGDMLTCQPQATAGHYVCVLNDGTDIATVVLVNGGARVAPDAPDSYRVQQGEALENKRGFWVNPPPDILLAATTARVPVCCAFAAGDSGGDGITYAGGVPVAVIGGVSTFLVFGGAAGWGYYDQTHRWHTAPVGVQAHMQHFHPDASGLRGYNNGVTLAHGTEPGFPRGPQPGSPHGPGGPSAGGRQYGMAGAPGTVGAGSHQGMPSGFRPGAPSGGFVRPPPSPSGFHPGGASQHGGGVPLTAPHPTQLVRSGGGNEKHRQ